MARRRHRAHCLAFVIRLGSGCPGSTAQRRRATRQVRTVRPDDGISTGDHREPSPPRVLKPGPLFLPGPGSRRGTSIAVKSSRRDASTRRGGGSATAAPENHAEGVCGAMPTEKFKRNWCSQPKGDQIKACPTRSLRMDLKLSHRF
jgi:hypothetical protein